MRALLTEKQKDRAARAAIRIGGILVILVVVAIVLNIGLESLPLFGRASAGPVERIGTTDGLLVVGSDPRREIAWALHRDATIVFPGDGARQPIRVADGTLVAADHEIHGTVSMVAADGLLTVGRVRFRDLWEDGERSTTARWRALAEPLALDPERRWVGVTAATDGEGGVAAAAWDVDGAVELGLWDTDDEEWQILPSSPVDVAAASVAIADGLGSLAVVDGAGGLHVYRLPALEPLAIDGYDEPVAALRYLIGGGSLVAAGRSGSVSVLLEVPMVEVHNGGGRDLRIGGRRLEPGDSAVLPDDQLGQRLASRPNVELRSALPVLQVARRLPPMPAAARSIAPAHRRRGFVVGAEDGTVALYYSTSGRLLLSERWADAAVQTLAVDPKGDGAVVVAGGQLLRRRIDNPHPEISLRTLFLPVWYEGYAVPKWVWQSTGGSDAFEPKMSLWPLLFGTLKATLYAMLLSVPLALMAAVYVSQLAPPWLQATVKPVVELMAAVPSVVVGFLAALWLAPRLESALLACLIAAAVLPTAVAVAVAVWRLVPDRLRRRLSDSGELLLLLACGGAVVGAAALLAGPLESWLFDGDFQRFLFTEWGIRYDQRNSLVVGLALGFAVIPVIFSIAEDACSAVPRSLVTASRALGATRWQTAVRLVVPAASPGLFAAVMLGLGRAVGETMIVLMAAGNTPLLDGSPFNGMRTMSAAIAVEIPEAPVGSTLFRVLFLTGTLLFVFTLAVTTVADVVGSYLRKRYARF